MTRDDFEHRSARERLRLPAVAVGLVILVGLVYGQVAGHGFVHLDDDLYIVENPHVRAGWTAAGVRAAFATIQAAYWHPLTWLSHMLDVELFGMDPGPHHLVSVGLHALGAVLLLLAWRALGGGLWRGALIAALFALHPTRIESVAWAAERKDVLSGVFFFATLWAYAVYARRPSLRRYLVVLVALGLGLMAKPMLVTTPLVLLALDYWPLGRWHHAQDLRRLLREKLPLVALCAVGAAITWIAQSRGGTVGALESLPLGPRVANALWSSGVYLGQTIWPVNLAFFYPHPALLPTYSPVRSALEAAAALVVLCGVAVVCWRQVAVRPALIVGWCWFLAMLAPVSGIFQAGLQARADRFTYLPMVGLFVALVWLLGELAVRHRRLAVAVAIAALGGCLISTWSQVSHWRDARTLAERALHVTRDNFEAHNLLGVVASREGALAEAATHFERAAAINDYPVALRNLAAVRIEQRREVEAVQLLERALGRSPRYAEALNDLGVALERTGRPAESRRRYEQAVVLRPADLATRLNLGDLCRRQGDLSCAERHLTQALRLDPRDARTRLAAGRLALVRRDYTGAATHLIQAVRAAPQEADPHNDLAVALERLGRLDEARAHLEIATRIAPDRADVQHNLGLVQSRMGRTQDSERQLERAAEFAPPD